MYRAAVIGAYDSIYGFVALGLDIFPVTDPRDGEDTLKKLASDNYAVIYITEALAAQLEKTIQKYKEQLLPAIILIPGVSGNTGAGVAEVKASVEKAVGSDILFSNE